MMEITTYPEMNDKIKGLLRLSEEPMELYAAQRIEELEQRLAAYENAEKEGRIIKTPCKFGDRLYRITKPYRKAPKITEYRVKNFQTVGKKHTLMLEVQALDVKVTNLMAFSKFITTREAAEKALREVQW